MNSFLKGLVAVAAVSLPGAAFAQSGDVAYCNALSQTYQKYVATAETGHNPQLPSVDVENAIAECQAGKTAAAIPVLEKKLRDAKVDLPARTAASQPVKASTGNCGVETWSTDQMMYVGVPCGQNSTYDRPTR
ncbi:MAG: hypothetical protein JO339_22245 [Alphaproteobacteria bacterium]|nr:hypothetical protein [Alphaproteobacteria bacterium]